METELKPSFIQSLSERRFLILMVSVLLLLALSPLLDAFIGLQMLLNLFLSVIMVSGIFAVSHKKYLKIIASLLALPMLVAIWASYVMVESPGLFLLGEVCGILFFALVSVVILSFIFRTKEVTQELIYGAVVVYLFLGLMWGFIYLLMESLQPGSFSLASSRSDDLRDAFFYYSFVTLSTLGYGDISPMSNVARNYSLLEAVIGQIYLTVLVARLVGMHISQSMEKKND